MANGKETATFQSAKLLGNNSSVVTSTPSKIEIVEPIAFDPCKVTLLEVVEAINPEPSAYKNKKP